MLEAFQSLREELAIKKPSEVEPSPHASKAGPSSNIWTYPLRDQVLMLSPRQWMWTLVQQSLLD